MKRQLWVTCPWFKRKCQRRIVRLAGPSPFMHITPDTREMIPLPGLVAETAPGASVIYDGGIITMTCPRGHVTTYTTRSPAG